MALDFSSAFRVFSRRKQNQGRSLTPLTSKFRQRFLMLLRSALSESGEIGVLPGDYTGEFYVSWVRSLPFRVGQE